ncbi:MAG: Rieske (2Fe-2S) protein [Bacteroidia bacterium]|nr:Rieske (2Fe-2S) protein [Bacteroidia bacterium]MDW8158254.1 Rieske (2Fe-2S) protein [Bacteroidia bacterium]
MQKQRRKFLGFLAGWIAGALQGCNFIEEKELIAGQLANLAFEKYWLREFNGKRIIIFYNQGEPYTLSLVCTHKKCTVRYRASEGQFICPCHKGRYDIHGNVLSGKPPKPLAKYKTIIRPPYVVVLNQIINEQ